MSRRSTASQDAGGQAVQTTQSTAVTTTGQRVEKPAAGAVALPVMEAEDKQPILPGQVLLAPPDYHLMVEDDGHVALSVDAPPMYSMPSIDVLFESAAHVWQHELLAIVLTGASADGAQGAAAVRRAGGRVWVQDPGEAEMPMMPAAALAAAGADAVLTLKQMVQQLAGVGR